MTIKKVAIITEFLFHFGGIEKSILQLYNGLKARGIEVDIYCGLYDPSKTYDEFKEIDIKSFTSEHKSAGYHSIWLRQQFSKLKLSGYDGHILFGFHSLAAAENNHPNVIWEQGPLSYLYLDYDAGIKKGIKKFLKDLYLKRLRSIDQQNIKGVDHIFSLGPWSNRKLKEAYPDRDNEILFQPVDINKYNINVLGLYYLSIGRLGKHVDKVVKAFQKMPDKQLHVYGAGSEEEKAEINALAKGYPNIHILGFAEEKDIPKIFGNCIAAIGINIEEDFHMGLMEALASGKPSISINLDPNIKENIVMGPTGVLIKSADPDTISKAVQLLNKEVSYGMRYACKERAKDFSCDHFVDTILKRLENQKV